jgi:succinyl-CoA synthetase beta subunit
MVAGGSSSSTIERTVAMLLIEADGKSLFRQIGIPVPEGVVVETETPLPALPGDGPWVVKAQVPVGGRGKAGGVAVCRTRQEVADAVRRMIGKPIRGHVVRACLIERAVEGVEAYVSLVVDAAEGAVRVMYSGDGGVDIEQAARQGGLMSVSCEADIASVRGGIADLAGTMTPAAAAAFRPIAERLAALLFEKELLLAEVNPLFCTSDGAVAGDAKIVVDTNALERQPELRAFIDRRPQIYRDVWRKVHEGFDFIDLDDDGSIGLVTTGAGLSMMLIDELVTRGGRPINFCDIRTGQFRGSPERLIRVLEWLADKKNIRVIFINIFAGITDLGEFARLLVRALERSPAQRVPVIARLVGTGEQAAIEYLKSARPGLSVYSDLEPALAKVISVAAA